MTTRSNMEKHRYYEANKEKILTDLRSIGRPATRKKWSIPSGTLSQLEKKWMTPQEIQALTLRSMTLQGPWKRRQAGASSPNKLPPFPEFSNEWAESVQFKWLEIYEMLLSIPGSSNQAG